MEEKKGRGWERCRGYIVVRQDVHVRRVGADEEGGCQDGEGGLEMHVWLGGKIMLCFELCWKDVEIALCFDRIASCALLFILIECSLFPCHGLRVHATVPLLPSRYFSTVTSRCGSFQPLWSSSLLVILNNLV